MKNTPLKLRGLVIAAGGLTLLHISKLNNIFSMIVLGSLVLGISISVIIKQFK
jgi:hypothetical protein